MTRAQATARRGIEPARLVAAAAYSAAEAAAAQLHFAPADEWLESLWALQRAAEALRAALDGLGEAIARDAGEAQPPASAVAAPLQIRAG